MNLFDNEKLLRLFCHVKDYVRNRYGYPVSPAPSLLYYSFPNITKMIKVAIILLLQQAGVEKKREIRNNITRLCT